MSRFIQQPKDKKAVKKTERKVPLSKPGTYNQQAMDNAKPIYTGRGKY